MFARNKLYFLFAVCLLILGCKTNQIKYGQRDGIWIEEYSLDSIKNDQNYKSKEIYHLGKPIRTWKYFKNNKLIRKESYKKDFCKVTFYYENGKIEKTGKTKVDVSQKETHWYYDGNWMFFDTKGKLIKTIGYEYGHPMKIDSLKSNQK